MIYDSHAHLISDDHERYKPAPLNPSDIGPDTLKDPNTAEKFLRRMDENGVERAVAVQRAHIYGYDNSYTVDACAQYPDRLRAVVVVNAQDPKVAEQIQHWVDRGAVGIRLAASTREQTDIDWLASDAAFRAWETAASLKVSVCVHMFQGVRDQALAALETLATRFSHTDIVIDHMSNLRVDAPDLGFDTYLAALALHKRVYLKFTTINEHRIQAAKADPKAVMARAKEMFGANRLVWGSDLGQSAGSFPDMVGVAKHFVSDFTPEERDDALYHATRQVYGP